MIEEEGARLRDSRLAQAAELTAAKLETEIRGEVEKAGGHPVRRVKVGLEKVSDGSLAVAKVTIELEPDGAEAAGSRSGGETDDGPIRDVAVEAVADVEIEVEVGGKRATGDERAVAASEAGEDERLDRETRKGIAALVADRFGIASSIVEVKLPGEAQNARQAQ